MERILENIACVARGLDLGRGAGVGGNGGERSGSERRSHEENGAHGRVRQTKPPATQARGNESRQLLYRHFWGQGAMRSSCILQLTHLN